ncbi:bifunctional 5,10-methylenetetrahydrofolate dehydrogenase/5,10-methenyltetrahydrofolate cyclohydrolase [Candidatus Vampirococcus lugosii]|uniref:Bifunctional 5,10-methylene-tetrahydrofolate dehydrogenase/ 5,10-methylene-tetrahydrofolate cyclohydrolase n=1 Tax=Candidatus Vampirococcus lugosii TaxID=2789015 RepID=A0ABS5QJM7_9BACT|nr:bifunctional 5,10-methylenetetrahydrofolate dehydrogenase/5,10-methenyltetrahydrofolate cyclohydrolase [Candidatus Vampirococcus lugosii]MBS8121428.1 bifunctional 5,10-methylene-tetrahydrofolate dehydrogenase/ 5,10-methylene-tetrahydrofolate cyclohydrolase [Candidatus Vampirococcus lugosii]
MILYGKPVSDLIKEKIIKSNLGKNIYIGILLLSDDLASQTYVNHKKNFGDDVGICVKIFSKENINCENIDEILSLIYQLNNDNNCVGIIVQLPLNNIIEHYKADILSSISSKKDIDGLGGINFGLNLVGKTNFLPATPKSIINILKYYKLDDFEGKKISIIGQSNLIGKPLALEFMKKEAEVFSFNKKIDPRDLAYFCKQSDYIICATGVAGLINSNFVKNDKSQILIDVGFSKKGNKIMGDINFEDVKDKVKAISPVPGGVGPTTIACLFENILELYNN